MTLMLCLENNLANSMHNQQNEKFTQVNIVVLLHFMYHEHIITSDTYGYQCFMRYSLIRSLKYAKLKKIQSHQG